MLEIILLPAFSLLEPLNYSFIRDNPADRSAGRIIPGYSKNRSKIVAKIRDSSS